MITRRKFLKNFLKTGAALVLGPEILYASLAKYPLQGLPKSEKIQFRYPLMSSPDAGTKLNEELAKKARKLAENVITTDKPGVLSHKLYSGKTEKNLDYRVDFVKIEIDNYSYLVGVVNFDKSIPNEVSYDSLSIIIEPKGKTENKISFFDRGLDGLCNTAEIPKELGGTGEEISFDSMDDKFGTKQKRDLFLKYQQLYHGALDALINFYYR